MMGEGAGGWEREFFENARRTDGDIANLRLQVTELGASVRHLPAAMSELQHTVAENTKAMNEMALKIAQRPEAASKSVGEEIAFAIHRVLDERSPRGGRAGHPILLTFAFIGVAATALVIGWVVHGL